MPSQRKSSFTLPSAVISILSSISLFKLAKKHIKEGDEVIVLTNPAFMMLFMPKVRRLTGCRYHILVHDIFPENLVSIGKFSNQSFVFKCLKKLFIIENNFSGEFMRAVIF